MRTTRGDGFGLWFQVVSRPSPTSGDSLTMRTGGTGPQSPQQADHGAFVKILVAHDKTETADSNVAAGVFQADAGRVYEVASRVGAVGGPNGASQNNKQLRRGWQHERRSGLGAQQVDRFTEPADAPQSRTPDAPGDPAPRPCCDMPERGGAQSRGGQVIQRADPTPRFARWRLRSGARPWWLFQSRFATALLAQSYVRLHRQGDAWRGDPKKVARYELGGEVLGNRHLSGGASMFTHGFTAKTIMKCYVLSHTAR